jgi:hypothetical protein
MMPMMLLTLIPSCGREPWNLAEPKENTPPSLPTIQYPSPLGSLARVLTFAVDELEAAWIAAPAGGAAPAPMSWPPAVTKAETPSAAVAIVVRRGGV